MRIRTDQPGSSSSIEDSIGLSEIRTPLLTKERKLVVCRVKLMDRSKKTSHFYFQDWIG